MSCSVTGSCPAISPGSWPFVAVFRAGSCIWCLCSGSMRSSMRLRRRARPKVRSERSALSRIVLQSAFLPANCREFFFRPSDRRKRGKNGISPEKYRACEAIFACKVAQIGNKSYFCMLKIGKFLIGYRRTRSRRVGTMSDGNIRFTVSETLILPRSGTKSPPRRGFRGGSDWQTPPRGGDCGRRMRDIDAKRFKR